MSKIIPAYVLSYRGKVNAIYGLNSARIFDIKAKGNGAEFFYESTRRDTMVVSDKPQEIYRSADSHNSTYSHTLSLVGHGTILVDIDEVLLCYADERNFLHSYIQLLAGSTRLYHIDLSLLDLILELNSFNMEILDNIYHETREIAYHFHNTEHWFGEAVTPVGESHLADPIEEYTNLNVIFPFVADAGNDNWGPWIQIFGSEDTPHMTDSVKFDFHKVEFVASGETNAVSFLMVAWGGSGAGAYAAGNYTVIPYLTPTNQASETPVPFKCPRIDVGTKVWGRCLAWGENTMELAFFAGIHEYPLI